MTWPIGRQKAVKHVSPHTNTTNATRLMELVSTFTARHLAREEVLIIPSYNVKINPTQHVILCVIVYLPRASHMVWSSHSVVDMCARVCAYVCKRACLIKYLLWHVAKTINDIRVAPRRLCVVRFLRGCLANTCGIFWVSLFCLLISFFNCVRGVRNDDMLITFFFSTQWKIKILKWMIKYEMLLYFVYLCCLFLIVDINLLYTKFKYSAIQVAIS